MNKVEPALLDEIVVRVRDAVHRIILFGSAARGEMGRDSDLDLLVVVPDGTHRRRTSWDVYRSLRRIGASKDVIVVTEKDMAEYGANHSLVLKLALEQGKELYAAK